MRAVCIFPTPQVLTVAEEEHLTVQDLKQRAGAPGNARQLRADLQAWAADTLAQRYTFQSTFLFGCAAGDIPLAMLEGEVDVRAEIGAFVGIVVGAELRWLQAVGPAIAAVDWAAHDSEDWAVHDSNEESD